MTWDKLGRGALALGVVATLALASGAFVFGWLDAFIWW
jgi:hypothetical protein